MSDGTSDRGAKPPRTLFSLGRTAAKKPDDVSAEPAAGDVVVAEPGIDLTEPAATETPTTSVEAESGFLCGACESPLPVGAVFCGECGTPVAGLGDDVAPGGSDVVAAGVEAPAEPFVPVEEAPFEPVEEAPFVPVEEVHAPTEPTPASASTESTDPTGPTGADVVEPVEAAGPVTLAPAAVLYADPSQAEPLPGKLEGNSWAISAPGFGTTDGDFVTGDEPSAAPHDPAAGPAWAVPATEVPAAAAAATVTTAAVAAGAPPIAGSGTTAATMPYGHGPVESSEKKSRTGLIIGAAAAAVLVLIVGIVALAAGGKKDDSVQAAQTTPTSGKVSSGAGPSTSASSSTDASTVTTEKATTSIKPATTDPASTAATTIVDVPTTVPQVVITNPTPTATPTTPRPTSAPTTATTVRPGNISATPASGQTIPISKNGTTQIVLQNTGGTSASCTVSVEKGNLSLSRNCAPNIPPGGTVTITIRANVGFEGQGVISGLMEGLGSYQLNVFVQNGN